MDKQSLIREVSRYRYPDIEDRGRQISGPLFYKWLEVCGVVPKGRRLKGYTNEDRDRLVGLANHLYLGGGYEEYQNYLIEREKHHGNQQATTTEPIECYAQQA